MIRNEEQIEEYKANYNKIYIPTQYYNENYKYNIDNEMITIITNNNCYQQYNTTYCDCYRYNIKYNIVTNSYSCNNNPSQTINHQYITQDINNSERITKAFIDNYFISYGIIIIVLLFMVAMKKNSRKI